MVILKPYRTRLVLAWCAALLLPSGLFISAYDWQNQGAKAPLFVASGDENPQTIDDGKILNHKDTELYKTLFRANRNADWATADTAIEQISDKMLVGTALAQRYLNRHYNTTRGQFADWLEHYADLPQAASVYAFAISKYPAMSSQLHAINKQPSLGVYGAENDMASLNGDSPFGHTWRAGLAAWKNGKKEEAAKMFSMVADHSEKLSPWVASASAYWAWRAYDALGNQADAMKYLLQASAEPRSFYGILARKQLKQSLGLDKAPARLSKADREQMTSDQATRRLIALAQIGQDDQAELELRTLFPQANAQGKSRLLALAHELKMASAQISMAKQMSSDDHALDYARYPIPNWKPENGFKVDPALMFAVMRQESGFRASAVSTGGALGVMQLMPQTASLMQKRMNTAGVVTEPSVNMMLGQSYVQNLLGNDLVNGNLFYLLAAYNAGPARLQEWKENAAYQNDPLLFVESIPYTETRNYVLQVMTNYWIYRELTGASDASVVTLLHGQWPSYALNG